MRAGVRSAGSRHFTSIQGESILKHALLVLFASVATFHAAPASADSSPRTTATFRAQGAHPSGSPGPLAVAGPEGDLYLTFQVSPVWPSCALQGGFTYGDEPPAKATVRWYTFSSLSEGPFYNHDGGWIELTHAGISAVVYQKPCVNYVCTPSFPTGANGWAQSPWLYSIASPAASSWYARESSSVNCYGTGGSWTIQVHWRLVDVSVSPASAQVAPLGNRQFSAQVVGSSGDSSVTWSVQEGAAGGAVTSNGLYTAPSVAGIYHVVATSRFDSSRSATATIVVPPVGVSVTPKTTTLLGGQSIQLTATVSNATNTSVTWTVQEGPSGGTVTSAGRYTAPVGAGTYHIVARSVADSSKSDTATVTVPAVGVSLSPQSATVLWGGSAQFTSSVSNAVNTAVTWSVQEGVSGGNVTTGGLYTPPSAAGTYHVVAVSTADPTRSAVATVTVPAVTVSVAPAALSLFTWTSAQYTATVTGAVNSGVIWSVSEGAGGSVTSSGIYTAPSAGGTYHLVATSIADSTKAAVATITVSPRALVNGGFEAELVGWNSAGAVPIQPAGGGGKCAELTSDPNLATFAFLDQSFDVPAGGGSLSFVYAMACAQGLPTYSYAAAALRDEVTGVTYQAALACQGGRYYFDLAPLAGHWATIMFSADAPAGGDDGADMVIDDVALSAQPPPAPVVVTVTPSTATATAGSTTQFAAQVTGASNAAVTWTVLEGVAGGSVSSTGLYTAAAMPGTYHVVATSQADGSKNATATVTVTKATTLLENGGFETGTLVPWSAREAWITSEARSGIHAAVVGGVQGDSYAYLTQTFDVPLGGGTISFWYKSSCDPSDGSVGALVRDAVTGATYSLPVICDIGGSWRQVVYALTPLQGHLATLTFSEADAWGTTTLTVDDVACSWGP